MRMRTRLKQSILICAAPMLSILIGCTIPPAPPGAVLAGDWYGVTQDNVSVVVTFSESGILVTIQATNAGDDSATLVVANATTEVDGNNFTITIPVGETTAVYEATLSADEQTLDGSVTSAIEVGDGDATIIVDAGELTLSRDPGAGELEGHINIALKDRLGNPIALESAEPYSPRQTCGGCHDIDRVANAYHFQQGRTDLDGDIVTEPDWFGDGRDWVLSPGMYGKW